MNRTVPTEGACTGNGQDWSEDSTHGDVHDTASSRAQYTHMAVLAGPNLLAKTGSTMGNRRLRRHSGVSPAKCGSITLGILFASIVLVPFVIFSVVGPNVVVSVSVGTQCSIELPYPHLARRGCFCAMYIQTRTKSCSEREGCGRSR